MNGQCGMESGSDRHRATANAVRQFSASKLKHSSSRDEPQGESTQGRGESAHPSPVENFYRKPINLIG
jgi:hypothetical protein